MNVYFYYHDMEYPDYLGEAIEWTKEQKLVLLNYLDEDGIFIDGDDGKEISRKDIEELLK